ncbi:hypothetical protein QAD02_007194 [Eretmocerus hayati]|uniref:Uncharacterized protein n=1 Tax=Eretmocerus hayati TaxID=131215 RepID=A0ACC2N5F8_9HYME|nr:hypothetical protein QAD02_007194 [Eretmocerus hayati]
MIVVYMVLLYLPPYLRSEVKNIRLVILCKEEFQKKYGWGGILQPSIADLKKLEKEGIDDKVQGYCECFPKYVHQCRYCSMTFEEFLKDPLGIRALRFIEEYAKCVADAKEGGATVKGINFDSPFNEWSEYHVSEPGLSPCIDHDMYEDFLAVDMWYCIRSLVGRGFFRIKTLDSRLNKTHFEEETE